MAKKREATGVIVGRRRRKILWGGGIAVSSSLKPHRFDPENFSITETHITTSGRWLFPLLEVAFS